MIECKCKYCINNHPEMLKYESWQNIMCQKLQVFAIELVTLAVDFVLLAIEFGAFAVEFVGFAA